MNYSSNIPALPNLANANGLAHFQNVHPVRNAIVAGAPVNPADGVDTAEEYDTVRQLKRENLATVNEEQEAAVRNHAVLSEHAQAVYGAGVGAPPWAVPMLAGIAALQGQFAALQGQCTSIEARLSNERIRRINRAFYTIGHPLVPLQKENAGYLNIAAITPGHVVVPPALALVPLVGVQPALMSTGGIFPDLHNDLATMSHATILDFIRWYNDDMGIVVGDNHGERVTKIQKWIKD